MAEPPDPSRLTQLGMSLKEKLEEINSEIFDLVAKELADEIDQADLYKEKIYATMVRIERSTMPLISPAPHTAAGTSTETDAGTTHTPKVRLPKL